MNTHIQSLKVWLKSILPWLKILGDCFFGAPCISLYRTLIHNATEIRSNNVPFYPPDSHHFTDQYAPV